MKYQCDTCGKKYAALPYSGECMAGAVRAKETAYPYRAGPLCAGFGPDACFGKVLAVVKGKP